MSQDGRIHEWVSMSIAAQKLSTKSNLVTTAKLSRLAKRGVIQTKDNPYDERQKLVDLVELRTHFNFED